MYWIVIYGIQEAFMTYTGHKVIQASDQDTAIEEALEDLMYSEVIVAFGPFDEKPNEVIQEPKEECNAVIYHGPGHQSKTKCYLKGEHTIHETEYGSMRQVATWSSDEVYSGFFDEPPE